MIVRGVEQVGFRAPASSAEVGAGVSGGETRIRSLAPLVIKREYRRSQLRSESNETFSSSSDTARAAARDTASLSSRPASLAIRDWTSVRLSHSVSRLFTRSCTIMRSRSTMALLRSLQWR